MELRRPIYKPYLPKTEEEYKRWIVDVLCVTCKAGLECRDYSDTEKTDCKHGYCYDYYRHCAVERRFKDRR